MMIKSKTNIYPTRWKNERNIEVVFKFEMESNCVYVDKKTPCRWIASANQYYNWGNVMEMECLSCPFSYWTGDNYFISHQEFIKTLEDFLSLKHNYNNLEIFKPVWDCR
jgi:hypothetical protein